MNSNLNIELIKNNLTKNINDKLRILYINSNINYFLFLNKKNKKININDLEDFLINNKHNITKFNTKSYKTIHKKLKINIFIKSKLDNINLSNNNFSNNIILFKENNKLGLFVLYNNKTINFDIKKNILNKILNYKKGGLLSIANSSTADFEYDSNLRKDNNYGLNNFSNWYNKDSINKFLDNRLDYLIEDINEKFNNSSKKRKIQNNIITVNKSIKQLRLYLFKEINIAVFTNYFREKIYDIIEKLEFNINNSPEIKEYQNKYPNENFSIDIILTGGDAFNFLHNQTKIVSPDIDVKCCFQSKTAYKYHNKINIDYINLNNNKINFEINKEIIENNINYLKENKELFQNIKNVLKEQFVLTNILVSKYLKEFNNNLKKEFYKVIGKYNIKNLTNIYINLYYEILEKINNIIEQKLLLEPNKEYKIYYLFNLFKRDFEDLNNTFLNSTNNNLDDNELDVNKNYREMINEYKYILAEDRKFLYNDKTFEPGNNTTFNLNYNNNNNGINSNNSSEYFKNKINDKKEINENVANIIKDFTTFINLFNKTNNFKYRHTIIEKNENKNIVNNVYLYSLDLLFDGISTFQSLSGILDIVIGIPGNIGYMIKNIDYVNKEIKFKEKKIIRNYNLKIITKYYYIKEATKLIALKIRKDDKFEKDVTRIKLIAQNLDISSLNISEKKKKTTNFVSFFGGANNNSIDIISNGGILINKIEYLNNIQNSNLISFNKTINNLKIDCSKLIKSNFKNFYNDNKFIHKKFGNKMYKWFGTMIKLVENNIYLKNSGFKTQISLNYNIENKLIIKKIKSGELSNKIKQDFENINDLNLLTNNDFISLKYNNYNYLSIYKINKEKIKILLILFHLINIKLVSIFATIKTKPTNNTKNIVNNNKTIDNINNYLKDFIEIFISILNYNSNFNYNIKYYLEYLEQNIELFYYLNKKEYKNINPKLYKLINEDKDIQTVIWVLSEKTKYFILELFDANDKRIETFSKLLYYKEKNKIFINNPFTHFYKIINYIKNNI
jgi:uncharacterized membrane protein YfbV (UPF0208 family)